MDQLAFDAGGFVRIDISTGEIRSAAEERLALLPAGVVASLQPGEALSGEARRWGEIHGKRLANKIAEGHERAEIEVLAEHLAGVLAVAGLGRAALEIRGDALLLRLHSPAGGSAGTGGRRALVAGFLAGYLSALEPAGFDAIHLLEKDTEELFWAGAPAAVERVDAWLAQGVDPLAALDRLAEGGAE
ncbi:MAG: hypothetical protein R6V85_15925 [Polyangia bacterium]